MTNRSPLADVEFSENGSLDVGELNDLYKIVGWDSPNRRTVDETAEMLRVSRFYVAACLETGTLVGFARVCGDPYVVQVLDVITHPQFRRRGIATQCMQRVLGHLQKSTYVSVTLTDGTKLPNFYERFDFHLFEDVARRWNPRR